MTVSSCRLYLITPPALPDLERFSQELLKALDAGDVAVVQLRLKEASDDEILKAASKLCPLVQSRGAAFLLNDRPDLAKAACADGVHVGPEALRLLVRAKTAGRIALVTDSIRRQEWDVVARRGAYYTRRGLLAGSQLTMIAAVKRMATACGVPLADAVRMASEVPARLLRLGSRGALRVGARADLVVFDRTFRVRLTLVGGRLVYRPPTTDH